MQNGRDSLTGFPMDDRQLDRILERARAGIRPEAQDLLYLLAVEDPGQLDRIFAAARCLRERHFGNHVFLYGFVYFSTYCRNACRFCNYRQANTQIARYRKTPDEIVSAAGWLADAGVHLIDLTMGEDPACYDDPETGFLSLVQWVRSTREATGLPLMVSPGAVPEPVLRQLRAVGADWFACYQETHREPHFQWLRPHQDYRARWQAKVRAKQMGFLVEEGILCGAGETDADIVDSLAAMADLGADQVRAMQFVPQPGTPMAGWETRGFGRELLIIALMRLMFPDRLIPASLDVEGLSGLERRLRAGANVVTSLVPPGEGLMGVSRRKLDIDTARRSPAAVADVLEQIGFAVAPPEAYARWLTARKAHAVAAHQDQ